MRHPLRFPVVIALVTLAASVPAFAQYTPAAGQNAPAAAIEQREVRDARGKVHMEAVRVEAPKDAHGNAQGNRYDLAVDGAFDGQTVLIIDEVGNTLDNTVAALKEKGFSSVVFHTAGGGVPSVSELQKALAKSCEVWLISTDHQQLTAEHVAAIKKFFDAGHGVYIWGDNQPLYFDADVVANALVPQLGMSGDLPGDKVVGISHKAGAPGVRSGHLVTTGLQFLYEGVTIATIYGAQELTPLLYGSAGNLVTAAYEKDGKRLVIDGGFTRLAVSWDDAGTARYVKNAASWLANAERFNEIVAKK